MSSPTIATGRTWANGETVTPTRLNEMMNEAELQFTKTDVIAGRVSADGGPAEEIDCTAAARALLAALSAAAQRLALGLGTAATQNANAVALTGGSAGLDHYSANPDTLAYGATVNLDFSTAAKTCQTITLAGNLTLTTSNRASGRAKWIRLVGDSSARTLTLPSGWVPLHTALPTTLAANKTAVLFLMAFGTAETDILASYAVQP